MPQQSLFKACKNIYRSDASGTDTVGDYNISFELYKQSDIDANIEAIAKGEATECTFGDSDQNKVVLVADSVLTIPEGFNLTPVSPKKSMVIMCNTLVNNGTISMTAKGPNIEPHDWFILNQIDNYGELDNIIIPAYANNGLPRKSFSPWTKILNGDNGNNGTNRQCGSGGQGSSYPNGYSYTFNLGTSGSGYAFGGGGGGCGLDHYSPSNVRDCDPIYPMHGGSSAGGTFGASGGVGNPAGNRSDGNNTYRTGTILPQNTGVGGRLIIYCSEFINNGIISADGVNTLKTWDVSEYRGANYGGASGGGAVDLFYYTLTEEGTITANGGDNFSYYSTPGKGGNGSITLLNWTINQVVKPQEKYMSKDNMVYFLQQLVNKINGGD